MSRTKPLVDNDSKGGIGTPETPVPVVACGPGWLVVDKPCGLSIHNDPGRDLCSLALVALCKGLLPDVGSHFRAVHAVHRLDRDTSGIVLLACDPKTLAFFGGQFAARTVRKHYLAVLHGRLDNPIEDRDTSDWKWPLTARAGGRKDPMGRGKRLPCVTRWRAQEHSLHFSLVQCEPLTGRKHQIRRHAKLAGHPVVGDRRYGSPRSLAHLSRHFSFHRLGLHAHALTIHLPGDEQPRTFQSGGLPHALGQLLEADR